MDVDVTPNLVFVSIPPILTSIFENMSAKELNTCAQVCKQWHSIAKTVKKRRHRVSWYFYEDEAGDADLQASCRKSFVGHLNKIYSEPKFALIIISKGTNWDKIDDDYCKRRKRALIDIEELAKYLPNSCDTLFCEAYDITRRYICDLNNQPEQNNALAALYFPTVPGVTIRKFEISDSKSVDVQKLIPTDQPIKCLFLFSLGMKRYSGAYKRTITDIIDQREGKVAVGGARVEGWFVPSENEYDYSNCFGIVIAGQNVQAASVILSRELDTAEKIEKKLRLLSETVIQGAQNFGFVFSCIARGENLFGLPNVESNVFRKLFPSVPLFGVLGTSEIGNEYLPNVLQKPVTDPFCHRCKAVFVLVSFKN